MNKKSKYVEEIKHLADLKQQKDKYKKVSVYDTIAFSKYGRNKNKNEQFVQKRKFNFISFTKSFLCILFVVLVFASVYVVLNNQSDRAIFRAVSNINNDDYSDKQMTIKNSIDIIEKAEKDHKILSVDNLNAAYLYNRVFDEDTLNNLADTDAIIPVTYPTESIDDIQIDPYSQMESVAGKTFTKLMNKYSVFENDLLAITDQRPEDIVKSYGLSSDKILAKYNPEAESQIKGLEYTYKIPHFSNINIEYYNGDGKKLEEFNNIKDIMSMASVFTYYHNPYDHNTFLNYCYSLFNNSLSFKPDMSDVYYCSGCMHYDENLLGPMEHSDLSIDKLKQNLNEQLVHSIDIKRTGKIVRTDTNRIKINNENYNEYLEKIVNGYDPIERFNYCPGHIDLNIKVTTLSLFEARGLISQDMEYGNNQDFFNADWNGWDIEKINYARNLSNIDWDEEYGIGISYINYIKPLTQEEINYYLDKLDDNISDERFKLIETALKAVGRIPYYYGGKPVRKGFVNNNFGSKVRADYKGRILKGLDCSGFITWAYWTAFDKKLVESEGTNQLALEGTKIRRYELKPGDIIVRPGYDSHVMMFYEWVEDGKMRVIHENGSVNNVSVGTFEAYYPYYRRLIDD